MEKISENFIGLFNRFEALLQKDLNINYFMSFTAMVREVSKKNSYIRTHQSTLESLADLRNVIVHGEGKKIMAIPSEHALNLLTQLLKDYESPIRVMDVCNRKVITISESRSLYDAFRLMEEFNYTKVPVYNRHGFVGLINGSLIARWLIHQLKSNETINDQIKSMTTGEALNLIAQPQLVNFIKKDMTLYDFIEMNRMGRPKSGVYIVTENGQKSDKPLGIITEYDYTKLLKRVFDSF